MIPAISSRTPVQTAGLRFGNAVSPAFVRFGESGDHFSQSVSPLTRERQRFLQWADAITPTALEKEDPIPLFLPTVNTAQRPDPVRMAENRKTLDLYNRLFPTFLWTGFEGSDPENRWGERWDLNAISGLYDKKNRARQIGKLKDLDIENVRLALPYHKIIEEKSWKTMDHIVRDLRKAGIKISLDLQHFGLPSNYRDNRHPEKSVFLNPAWTDQFVRVARKAVERYFNDIEAITIVNEPLVTNAFSGNHWNEAFPGRDHPEYIHFFVNRALLLGKAAAQARVEIEKVLQAKGERKIFVHNEAVDYKAGIPEDEQQERFITSDLIIGAPWLLESRYRALLTPGAGTDCPMTRWLEKNYIRKNHPEDRTKLVRALDEIRDIHLGFERAFGKTSKADTVFGVDYYITNESGEYAPGRSISHNPRDYAKDLREGHRKGLYGVTLEYWNRYQLPILHTETNMANEWGSRWGQQQLLELAQIARTPLEGAPNPKGEPDDEHFIPVLGFNWYSLMDQYGWDQFLEHHPIDANRNRIGLVSTRDFDERNVTKEVIRDLRAALKK